MALLADLRIAVLVLVLVHTQGSTINALASVTDIENESGLGVVPFWSFLTSGLHRKGADSGASDDGAGQRRASAGDGAASPEQREPRGGASGDGPDAGGAAEPTPPDAVHPDTGNRSAGPALDARMRCHEVRRERFRCCRVYDNVIEAWWCPHRRPFCCHQGTPCAICCTIDELRHLDAAADEGDVGPEDGDQPCPPLRTPARPRLPTTTAGDESWFWNGMKAAWLTMVSVLLVSVCCTCVAHKCITYLVKIVNEEDPETEDEYLAYQLDRLALEETAPADRQLQLRRGPLPPKYSDINFIPVTPEPVGTEPRPPNEPPPVYTSDAEAENAHGGDGGSNNSSSGGGGGGGRNSSASAGSNVAGDNNSDSGDKNGGVDKHGRISGRNSSGGGGGGGGSAAPSVLASNSVSPAVEPPAPTPTGQQ